MGGFGVVYEVKTDKMSKTCAAKLQLKYRNHNELDFVSEFRGPNIVKVNRVYEKTIGENNEKYSLILMEKASLKDLTNFINSFRKENIFNYILKYPYEMIGDNLVRFIVKQIVKGFETLYMSNYIHFDFKPENTLIFNNLVMKLTDFGLLRNLNKIRNNLNQVQIPGGTPGYIPPEYYSNEDHRIAFEEAALFDYFSLGATIFYLKYEKKMMRYFNHRDNLATANCIIDLIQRSMDIIKTTKSNEKDFIDFLCKLIQYKPEQRLTFEEIYRNKWLNKDYNQILEIVEANKNDDIKILEELNKSDFLFKKKIKINEKRKLMDEININAIDNIHDNRNKEKHKVKVLVSMFGRETPVELEFSQVQKNS